MWYYGRSLFISLLFVFSGLNASAASIEDARATYDAAQLDAAYEQAFALGTQQGYLLGAEALNAKLLLGEYSKPKKLAKRAMATAKMAFVQTNPDMDAQLQYAISYAFYGRHVSTLTALRKKIPQKIHAEIKKSLTLSENSTSRNRALTHALLGGWHLSVVHKAGAKRARKMFDANLADGRKHFEIAIALEPDNILICSNYTLMRYILSPQTEHEWAKKNLEQLLTFTAENEVETRLQARMQTILDVFDTPKHAQKLAADFLN
ncbi:MAG: hypothetical protein COA43_07435 [Robiginitomaculum sp.]|nr:MAG: hypothetical protein COA43_07435 [Robiginitomaculum sp.]